MKRLGPNAHLINLKLNHSVPASVRLLPAKEYRGAAIGINYDLRIYTGKVQFAATFPLERILYDVPIVNEMERVSS